MGHQEEFCSMELISEMIIPKQEYSPTFMQITQVRTLAYRNNFKRRI